MPPISPLSSFLLPSSFFFSHWVNKEILPFHMWRSFIYTHLSQFSPSKVNAVSFLRGTRRQNCLCLLTCVRVIHGQWMKSLWLLLLCYVLMDQDSLVCKGQKSSSNWFKHTRGSIGFTCANLRWCLIQYLTESSGPPYITQCCSPSKAGPQ